MNKQLRKNIALVRGAFIYGDNCYNARSIEKFLSGQIDGIKYVHIDRFSTVVISDLGVEEFYHSKTCRTNLVPLISYIASSLYKNLDMMTAPSKANTVFFLDKDTEIKFSDINTMFVVGFEHGAHDVLTYVFDNKDKKYTKKFWKRLGAHRLKLIKYFKKAEESKKLKCTIDSHVAYHLRKYYNALSPSEKLEVELDL